MADIPVARGDRRKDLWIQDDARQLTKVRHTWPDDAPPPQGMDHQGEVPAALARATDAASVPEAPSAWEAIEDDDPTP